MAGRSSFAMPNTQKSNSGPYGLIVPLAFTAAIQTINSDIIQEMQTNAIDMVQSIFIDNTNNAVAFAITFGGFSYSINVRAGRFGIWPILVPQGPVSFSANSPVATPFTVNCIFMNQIMPYMYTDK